MTLRKSNQTNNNQRVCGIQGLSGNFLNFDLYKNISTISLTTFHPRLQ